MVIQLNKKVGELMEYASMIEKLKKVGIKFTDGLSDKEIEKIENTFGFKFPKEITSFLSYAYPINDSFFNYRNMSPENIKYFSDFQQRIEESFLFDIENNTESLQLMLEEFIGHYTEQNEFKNAVMNALHQSPRLIPFYAHRCFFDGMDEMPIISFWQAIDTIVYGSNLENYLENEFILPEFSNNVLGEFSDEMKRTGIWYYIIE